MFTQLYLLGRFYTVRTLKGTSIDIIKKAIRIVLKLKIGDSVKVHFKILKIITVYCMHIYQTILMNKERFNDMRHVCDTHNYNTRKRTVYNPTG